MRGVTIRQLEIFAAAADLQSLARVAERMRLTPSAVSFQIKQIELQSGFALFERTGRTVALTQPGAVLASYARSILGSLKQADHAMLALKGLTGGRIRLALVSTSKYIVPHMIARFRADLPDVTVDLIEGNRDQVLALLLSGKADLAVMGKPPEEADVLAEQFAPHPSVIIAPAGHRLGAAPSLTLAALAGERFIMREPGSGTKAMTDAFFADAGFRPVVGMVSSSNETIKQSVIAGMGLALISEHTVSLERALGLLRVLPVEGFPLMRAWFVVQRRTLPLLPVQARLRQFLIDEGHDTIRRIISDHAAYAA